MSTRGRAMTLDAEWDQAWAAYDARNPAPRRAAPPPPAPLPPRVAPEAARRRSRAAAPRRLLAGLAMVFGLAWVASPGIAALQAARAVETRDTAAIGRHLDLAAVQAALREDLRRSVALPGGGDAAAFLGAMAGEMAEAWSHPAALAEVARARGVVPGSATLLRAQPRSLTSFDMPLGAAASPFTLRFEMTEGGIAPRWQVTGIRLDSGAPAVAAGWAMRLSMR
ncbi:DUF2939 domain-containing protein [Falsiroseomonas sp. CW058]|uniref:DUF2939 domain-containing protein n=1 Tax=Falsiroseomonas sp. CW058 TaxID=3388664 RepID=UPI003D31B59A